MRTHPTACLTLALLVGVSLGWAPQVLAKPNIKAAVKACKPGTDPQAPGDESHSDGFMSGSKLTPQKLAGVTTVSPGEAKCLIDKLGKDIVVIAAMYTDKELPGTHLFPESGTSSTDPRVQHRFANKVNALAEGDKSRPLLVYCHHASCHLSYNASLRAVDAGYTNIFWLRDGNQGWISAGYYLKGKEPDAQGLVPDYHRAVKSCDKYHFNYTADDFATLAAQIPNDAELNAAFQSSLKTAQDNRRGCLGTHNEMFKGDQAALADTAKRVARSDSEVSRMHEDARKEVESNPMKFFKEYLDSIDVSEAADVVHKARSFKSLQEICGVFDTRIPTTNDAIDAANQRLSNYKACLMRVEMDKSDFIAAAPFQVATTTAASLARYSCSRKKIPNCLPDATLRRIADVASSYNNDLVQAASKRRQTRQSADLEAAIVRVNDWIDRTNAATDRRSAEIEEANERASRRSYSAPAYSSPVYSAPTPDYGRYGTGRRDSSTSAPGMR